MSCDQLEDIDDDAPTLLRKINDDDAPTVARRVEAPEKSSARKTGKGPSDRVRIHPKFDPRCLPTTRAQRPQPPPKRAGRAPSPDALAPARQQGAAMIGGLRAFFQGGVDLGWVMAFVVASVMAVSLAAWLAIFRQAG